MTVPGKGTCWTLSGSKELVESYIKRFNCVPVFDGDPPSRKIARLNALYDWDISDLDGSTELEQMPTVIEGATDQQKLLTTHDWYHIGFNAQKTLTQFKFGNDGQGYSRHAFWGWGTKVPRVFDYYWKFSIEQNLIRIEWDGEGNTQIGFALRNELRAASSLNDGGLNFFSMTLAVSAPIFPPSADFAQHLLLEYWGKPQI